MVFTFYLNQDTVFYSRTIYSVWDCLSDIGGLFDSLRYLVYPVLLLAEEVFGNQLHRFLVGKLFKLEAKKSNKKKFTPIKLIEKRKNAYFSMFDWSCSWRDKRKK